MPLVDQGGNFFQIKSSLGKGRSQALYYRRSIKHVAVRVLFVVEWTIKTRMKGGHDHGRENLLLLLLLLLVRADDSISRFEGNSGWPNPCDPHMACRGHSSVGRRQGSRG